MSTPLDQHQVEIRRNLEAWNAKPLLREIYAGFYARILDWVDRDLAGSVVEIGSGIGNLRTHLPTAVCTDLFPNPWLDVVCDGYELPFRNGSVSHLILFDVFHHLEAPGAFLAEARRVLVRGGRVIVIDPYMGWVGRLAYGLFHHEPVAWRAPLNFATRFPRPRHYYAAQGNATRLFFRRDRPEWPEGWRLVHTEALAAFSYLLSGGFSKPALYPFAALGWLRWIDGRLSRWPGLFGARCLVVLSPHEVAGRG